jgi:hypothetical protein
MTQCRNPGEDLMKAAKYVPGRPRFQEERINDTLAALKDSGIYATIFDVMRTVEL